MRVCVVLMCLLTFSKMVSSVSDLELEKIYERLEKLEKETPYMSMCAAKSSTKGTRRGKISYDSVFHSSTNIGEGGLDKCTGDFTAGVSGSYSVSWNGFSDSRGWGDSVVLRKNGGSVSETQCSWTMQGRTLMMELERGDTLSLIYNDWNDYGLMKLTFCVSLVHAHEIKPKRIPKMSVLPISKNLENPTYFLKLSPGLEENTTNHELAQSVEDSFKENQVASSQSCRGKNTPRNCGEECNLNDMKCGPGCMFEYDTLGECTEMPYGYVNGPKDEGIVNPCFFLKFNPVGYWNPQPNKYGVSDNIRRHSDDEQFQIDCRGDVESEEMYSYTELVEMDNTTFPGYIKEKVDYFIKDNELYDELAEVAHNRTHLSSLITAQEHISSIIFGNNGEKIMEKLTNYSTEFSNSLDEFEDKLLSSLIKKDEDSIQYNTWRLGSIIALMKMLETLPKNEKDKLFEEIYQRNHLPHHLSKTEFCKENLRLCAGNDMPASCCSLLDHFVNQNLLTINRTQDIMKLIKHIDTEAKIYGAQDLFSQIQENLSAQQKQNPELDRILNDKLLVDKLIGFSDDLNTLERVVTHLRDYGSGIKISFYPESQGISSKYFPLNGDEETPYVAIKLHLEDEPGLTAGQEIRVTCKALYEGAVHYTGPRGPRVPYQANREHGAGMVEFKIVLQ